MRRDLILLKLIKEEKPLSSQELELEFSISNKTLRNELMELNRIGGKSGFSIQKRGREGYFTTINDEVSFQNYLRDIDNHQSPTIPQVRVNNIVIILLQSSKFLTLDEIAEKILVSRSTIISDFAEVEKLVLKFDLALERKSHYGIRLVGSETNFRRAFSFFISKGEPGIIKKLNYLAFEEAFPSDLMRVTLREGLESNHLNLSYHVFENILAHIKVLSFRAVQQNFILIEQEKKLDTKMLKPAFLDIANKICSTISNHYSFELPISEVEYLAAHISGKSSVDDLSEDEKIDLKLKLKFCLEKLDKTFLMSFSEDKELLDMLALHMYPLLKRMYFNLELTNPLIEDIYSRYSDIFIISLNFSDFVEETWGFKLSKDEMGYLAMHFAAFMERENQRKLRSYKRILLLLKIGNASANLVKAKLSYIFQSATIDLVSYTDIKKINLSDYELLISSVPIEQKGNEIPFFKIPDIPDETDLQNIHREITKATISSKAKCSSFISMFHPDLFYRESGDNYLKILKDKSEDVVKIGFASEEYPQLVLEREKLFSTIFLGGIAGPHALQMVGTKGSVSVVILKKPIVYDGDNVQIIFLMNFCKGDLHLHKEFCNLILYLTRNAEARQKILKVKNFKDFIYEISKIQKK